jgi:hypothetical protein
LFDAILSVDRYRQIRTYLGVVFGDLHAKRIEALSGATLGVIQSASLAVCTIGQALAQARDLMAKHATKQVDRLLSNSGIDVWAMFADWVPEVVGEARDIKVVIGKRCGSPRSHGRERPPFSPSMEAGRGGSRWPRGAASGVSSGVSTCVLGGRAGSAARITAASTA